MMGTPKETMVKQQAIHNSQSVKQPLFLSSGFLIPLALFLVIVLINALLRMRFGITVTDTEFVDVPLINSLGDITIWFKERLGPYFRPIEYLFISWELGTFGVKNYAPMIIIHSVMAGMVAVLIYFMVMELTRSRMENNRQRILIATASSVLYCVSFHMIEVTWLILQKSMMTEIYVLTGLLGYLLYLRTGQNRWLIAIWVPGILGPLTRELPGVLALVILILTIVSRRRDFKLALTATVLSVHLLFPAFLPSLFMGTKLNLEPIVGMSMQKGLLIQGGLLSGISNIHFDLALRSALYFSPLAIIALFIPISVYYFGCKERLYRYAGISVLAILLLSLLSIYFPDIPILPIIASALFTLVVFLSGLRYGLFLPVLFITPILPFLFIPVYDVWLRLPAIAFIILSLLWITELPRLVANLPDSWLRRLAWLKPNRLPVALISLLIIFSLPNLIMAESTFRNFIRTHEEMAAWAMAETPKGSALISNLRQTHDIDFLTDKTMTAYYLPFPTNQLPPYGPMPGGAGQPLINLLNRLQTEPETPIYFLINERFGTNGFPELPPGTLKPVKQFETNFKYLVLDPLQLLLPTGDVAGEGYAKFGGPTDLLFQSKMSTGLFMREVQTKFDVYQYIGDLDTLLLAYDTLPAASGHGPRPWGDYKGFTITADSETLYAYPRGEGPYDWRRVRDNMYPALMTCRTQQEVREAIDSYPHPRYPAHLVEYKGFRIIGAQGTIYAIPKPEGSLPEADICLGQINEGKYFPVYRGGSIGEVTGAIDGNPYIGEAPESLALVEEGYKGFNIIANKGTLYAILQSDGAFDYERLKNGPYTVLLQGRTLEEVKEAIDNYTTWSSGVITLEDYKGFILITVDGNIYGFPRPDKPPLLFSEYLEHIEAGDYYPIYTGTTTQEVINAIDSNPYIGGHGTALILVEEDYEGFNIIANKGTLYAILQTDGRFGYKRLKNGPYTVLLQGKTLEEVKKAIDNYVTKK